jgi:hypothetical protein
VARPSYKSEKRKKEVLRQKKQEEKRLKRFNKAPGQDGGLADAATLEGLGLVPPPGAAADASTDASAEDGTDGEESQDPDPSSPQQEGGPDR